MSMSRRLAVVAIALVALSCASERGFPTSEDLQGLADGVEVDLSGMELNGEMTDVIADYWARAFSSLGESDTFALFAAKHDLLMEQDESSAEADAALAGFRRLCRLRYRLDRFDSFWSSRGRTGSKSGEAPNAQVATRGDVLTEEEPDYDSSELIDDYDGGSMDADDHYHVELRRTPDGRLFWWNAGSGYNSIFGYSEGDWGWVPEDRRDSWMEVVKEDA